MANFAVRLKDLLKIGSEVLNTTAHTLSGAVNELKSAVTEASENAAEANAFAATEKISAQMRGYNLIPLMEGWCGQVDVNSQTKQVHCTVNSAGRVVLTGTPFPNSAYAIHVGDIALQAGNYTLIVWSIDNYPASFSVLNVDTGVIIRTVAAGNSGTGAKYTGSFVLDTAARVRVRISHAGTSFAHAPAYAVMLVPTAVASQVTQNDILNLQNRNALAESISSDPLRAAVREFIPLNALSNFSAATNMPGIVCYGFSITNHIGLIKLPVGYAQMSARGNHHPRVIGSVLYTAQTGATGQFTVSTGQYDMMVFDDMIVVYSGDVVLPVPAVLFATIGH